MHAVLLFSAAVHVAAIGVLVAYALRHWVETKRPMEPKFPEVAMAAGAVGLSVAVVATILLWIARGFGHALLTGLVAGMLAAVAFLLALGAWPERPKHGGAPTRTSRITAGVFVGVFLLVQVVAFCFLASAAAGVPI